MTKKTDYIYTFLHQRKGCEERYVAVCEWQAQDDGYWVDHNARIIPSGPPACIPENAQYFFRSKHDNYPGCQFIGNLVMK